MLTQQSKPEALPSLPALTAEKQAHVHTAKNQERGNIHSVMTMSRYAASYIIRYDLDRSDIYGTTFESDLKSIIRVIEKRINGGLLTFELIEAVVDIFSRYQKNSKNDPIWKEYYKNPEKFNKNTI